MTEEELIATFNDTLSDIGEIGDSAVFIEPLEDLLHGEIHSDAVEVCLHNLR